MHIVLNVLPGNSPAIAGERAISFRENGSEGAACITPFVDDLLENAGVGMLRDETGSEHLNALPGDFFHHRGIVQDHQHPKGKRLLNLRA